MQNFWKLWYSNLFWLFPTTIWQEYVNFVLVWKIEVHSFLFLIFYSCLDHFLNIAFRWYVNYVLVVVTEHTCVQQQNLKIWSNKVAWGAFFLNQFAPISTRKKKGLFFFSIFFVALICVILLRNFTWSHKFYDLKKKLLLESIFPFYMLNVDTHWGFSTKLCRQH